MHSNTNEPWLRMSSGVTLFFTFMPIYRHTFDHPPITDDDDDVWLLIFHMFACWQ